VDPIKPTLKPTGTQRLKLKCDVLLSTSAFNFNLRRYSMEIRAKNKAKSLMDEAGGSFIGPSKGL